MLPALGTQGRPWTWQDRALPGAPTPASQHGLQGRWGEGLVRSADGSGGGAAGRRDPGVPVGDPHSNYVFSSKPLLSLWKEPQSQQAVREGKVVS